MEPIRVKWRIIAPGRTKAVEQRTVHVNYVVAEGTSEGMLEPAEAAEFNIIASSPERARAVTAALLRMLRQDSRCSVVTPEDSGLAEGLDDFNGGC